MRNFFSKAVKRAALRRSGGKCEASGHLYGLAQDQRCNSGLAYGVEFDHFIARSNCGDNSLQNCKAVCKRCHKFKTENHDTPRAAKTKRMSDKHNGIRGAKAKWPKQKFRKEWRPNVKHLEQL